MISRTQLHFFPTFAMGGAQRRFLRLANRMAGWRHIVVALDGVTEAKTAISSNVDYEILEVSLKKSAGFSPSNIFSLRRIITAANPDLLCSYNWGSIEVSIANRLGSRIPHIHFEDGFGPEEAEATLKRRDIFRRMALSGKTIVVVPSTNLAKIAREKWHVPNSRLRHMVNGVDTNKFVLSNTINDDRPVVIGTVGALRREKNIARLVRAVAKADARVELRVVGDGGERAMLENLATELNVPTVFEGNLDDPAAAYHGFDLFALTSDTEQMPLTVLEAMACGLPIVATDVGDIKMMVAPENAPFIIPLERATQALPAAIEALSHDIGRRKRIGQANRIAAETRYDERTVVAAYSALFADVIGG